MPATVLVARNRRGCPQPSWLPVTVDAAVIGTDPALAVLEIDPDAHELIPVRVADSTEVRVGEVVAAIGNPFGEARTLTTGIVSALGRSLPVGAATMGQPGPNYTIPDIIQTDAAINPGNSGGVLLNDQGELIGVPTAIASPLRASAGVGFAVPSVIVQKVVPVLIAEGNYVHPWPGVSGLTLGRKLALAMDLPRDQRGALVVLIGGDVITAVDGEQVANVEELRQALQQIEGDTASLTVLRNGEEQTIEVDFSA